MVKKMNKDTNKSVDNANRPKAIAFDKYNQDVCGETAPTLKRVQGGDDYPTVFTLKVRGGREIDSKGKKAGKGALINNNTAMTLGVSQDQTIFVPIKTKIKQKRGKECGENGTTDRQ